MNERQPGDIYAYRPANYWKRFTIALGGLALATLLTMLPGLLF
jgi:purine-cytosine permease-like protein